MIYYNIVVVNVNNSRFDKKSYVPNIKNFPDGTLCMSAPGYIGDADYNDSSTVEIVWNYENETELIQLIYLTKNLKERCKGYKFLLNMPYIPNARMDRVHKDEEVFTLKYFCQVINSLGFDEIAVIDAHSSVSPALLNNVYNKSPEEYINEMLKECNFNPDTDYMFFPDEGSCKRYSDLVKCKNIGFGIKKRDWDTGKIEGLDVFGSSPENKRVFIIDDICAYGGTVYYSALKLKELGCFDINVFFTHCENSIAEGKLFSCGLITNIYTTNSICTLEENDILHIINIG